MDDLVFLPIFIKRIIMKYIVIILLLNTSGIERIELKTQESNCGEIANAWREVNTTYHGSRNMDPKQQGNYTSDGRLMMGWICK